MSDKSKKHLAILTAARVLFHRYGFKKVSIEEICEEAGTSKMTFYKDFENKHTLAKAVLDHVVTEGVVMFKSIMEKSADCYEKINDIIRMKHSQQTNLGEIFLEDILSDHVLKEHLFSKQVENVELTITLFKLVKKEGVLRKGITSEYFIYLLDVYAKLYQDKGMMHLFPDVHERTEQIMNLFFFGISRPENHNVKNGGKK
ncbi:MAG: TetR/AcrR family transcriptional regulator [Leptospirales bacterium]